MKTHHYFTLLFCSIIVMLSSCTKEGNDQLAQLPQETQTGANTFGTLIDGQAFLPSGQYLAFPNAYVCAYITDGVESHSHFVVDVGNEDAYNSTRRIILVIDGQYLQEGQTYKLGNYDNGDDNYGVYETIYNSKPTDSYQASRNLDGVLIITKLDEVNHIVSGTFYFDAKNKFGNTVSVTDGRFDMTYQLD